MRLLLVVTLCLSGCSVAHKATLPDGTQGFVISHCNDMSYCYNRAAKLCGGKYKVIESGTNTQGALANGFGALDTHYAMTVKCGE